VVAKFRERLAASKQAAHKFDVDRFNLRKINELEVRKQYHTDITNRFAVFENLRGSKDINRTWENIKEKVSTSAKRSLCLYAMKQHKPWFDDECLVQKSPVIDQIPVELRRGIELIVLRSIRLLILFGIRRNCQGSGRS